MSMSTTPGFHLLELSCAETRGPRSLFAVPARGLRLIGAEGGARPADSIGDPCALELTPFVRRGQELLLARAGDEATLELNGLGAPLFAVLRAGDEIRLGPALPALFVDFYRPPPFRLATPEDAANVCPLCRGPLAAGRRVYACQCGAITHAEQASDPADGALECASGSCAACARPLVTEAGFLSRGGAHARNR
jgi:hypothetical protein